MQNLREYLSDCGVSVEGMVWPSYSQSAGSISDGNFDLSSMPLSLYVQEQYGRFGNNIHQVLHSLIVARRLAVKTILFSFYLDEAQTETIIIDDMMLKFGSTDTPAAPYVSATMFYLQGFEKFMDILDCDCIKQDAEKISKIIFLNRLCLLKNHNEKVVVFHFRSGDIFEDNINPIYTQPPLSYYIKAFQHVNATLNNFRIYIVYENTSNPCIKSFQEFLDKNNTPYEIWSESFIEDASLLIHASCIISSYSSFCDMLALMNENLERWYAFRWAAAFEIVDLNLSRDFVKLLKSNSTGVYIVRDQTNQYTPLGGWKFTKDQIEVLLNYPISNLSIEEK